MPPFFLDRYAYRLFTSAEYGESHRVQVPDYELEAVISNWEPTVQGSVVGLPSFRIDAPDLNAPVPVTGFLEELFALWREYLNDLGLSLTKAFVAPSNMSWRELFKRSVHFPRPPVIKGPTYFARLSCQQQEWILRRYGSTAALDFYIFLLQTHEESHMYQAGEPLLCELTHAWIWCNFLTKKDLWVFQRNENTGFICNLEAKWLERLRWNTADVCAMYTDTAEAVCAKRGADVYVRACELAAALDARQTTYQNYLAQVTELLSPGI